MIRFKCTSCNVMHTVEPKYAGRKAKCNKCGNIDRVPKPESFTTPLVAQIKKSAFRDVMDSVNSNNDAKRVPCPSCAELIMRGATICPHCQRAVFSSDKNANALISIVGSVVLFFVLYYFFSAFTNYEAGKEYDRILRDSKIETDQMMQDIERDTEQMLDRIKTDWLLFGNCFGDQRGSSHVEMLSIKGFEVRFSTIRPARRLTGMSTTYNPLWRKALRDL